MIWVWIALLVGVPAVLGFLLRPGGLLNQGPPEAVHVPGQPRDPGKRSMG